MSLKFVSVVAGGFLALGLVTTSAAAAPSVYGLSPANTAFTATGSIAINSSGGNLSCSVQMNGATTPAKITSATFSGATGCSDIMAAHLPWGFRPLSKRAALITHLSIFSPVIGQCGKNEAQATLVNGTLNIKDVLAGKKGGEVCRVQSSLTTSPTISIVTQ